MPDANSPGLYAIIINDRLVVGNLRLRRYAQHVLLDIGEVSDV